ncbi:MAG TPA: hypothetical protein VNM36_11735 [Gemmatimonadaceae bacterium]|jgi:hypothetical protein|nr:hypothetical protein [Gemmatimonadaceae bacterium]
MTATDSTTVQASLMRLNARAWGISTGLLLGGGLFLATVLLVIRGGPTVGQHLSLIRVFFPGYSVTWVGAFVGFIYAFVLGYGLGRIIGTVYNRLAFR